MNHNELYIIDMVNLIITYVFYLNFVLISHILCSRPVGRIFHVGGRFSTTFTIIGGKRHVSCILLPPKTIFGGKRHESFNLLPPSPYLSIHES